MGLSFGIAGTVPETSTSPLPAQAGSLTAVDLAFMGGGLNVFGNLWANLQGKLSDAQRLEILRRAEADIDRAAAYQPGLAELQKEHARAEIGAVIEESNRKSEDQLSRLTTYIKVGGLTLLVFYAVSVILRLAGR